MRAQNIAWRVRDWAVFQHYHNRRPPWIKLPRTTIEDAEWHELSPVSAKALVSIWLIASETVDGTLPDAKQLAFKLRMTVPQVQQILASLSYWIEPASNVLAPCLQVATPEREGEKEVEKENTLAPGAAKKNSSVAIEEQTKKLAKDKSICFDPDD